MAKTSVVNAAAKTALTTIFPVSTDATVAAGFTAAQITYLGNKIAVELQEQKAGPIIKDLFTRIMAV
jgi:hypothetical protein